MTREICKDIKSLEYINQNKIVELAEGQTFCKTERFFEIWNNDPLFLIKKISRKAIGWVTTY